MGGYRHGHAYDEAEIPLPSQIRVSLPPQHPEGSALLELASREKDYLAHDFLERFAREQLEECSSMDTLLKMVRRAGEPGLMTVENALASRPNLAQRGAAKPEGE